MKKLILGLILVYQRVFSLDHGIFAKVFVHGRICRFYPSCSEYSYQAIERFGILRGLALSFRRIIRCHPWGGSGRDEVPIS